MKYPGLCSELKKKNRRDYIMHKIDKCYFCRSTVRVQMHHILPNENDHKIIWDQRWERLRNEVEKCVPLCFSCHQKLHSMYSMRPIYHGTNFAYEIYRCKCDACVKAHKAALKSSMKRRDNETQRELDSSKANIMAIADKDINVEERNSIRASNKAKKDLKNNLEYKRALMNGYEYVPDHSQLVPRKDKP